MWRVQGRSFRGLDSDVRAKLFEAADGDASNGQQVFDAAERAAFLAEVHDSFGRDRANAGKLGQLLDGGGVEVEGLRRGLFLGQG